jgi:hypothetical protein
MAIADLVSEFPREAEAKATTNQGLVKVGVHDASRMEWSVSVPLPEDAPLKYNIRIEMQIPSLVRQSPWEQLQSYTRLDGPALSAMRGETLTIDTLRRGAVALATKLSRASEGFARHCRLSGTMSGTATATDIEDTLIVWIDAAERMTRDIRDRFAKAAAGEAAELSRERTLVDEYSSIRFLEMLAGAERALASLSRGSSANQTLTTVVAHVEARVADALERELLHRREAQYMETDPASSSGLERYLDRASRLKKHFQEVLFLEAETFQVADRIHHWVAALAAIVASTWAFAWQIWLTNRGVSTGSQVGSGIVVIAVMGGLVYASKDRLKEVGRNWVSRRVHKVYGAQRVARFRAPAKRLPGRDVIVTARESFDQTVEQLPDMLNPESGATRSVTVLRYTHKGQVLPQAMLSASGVRRVKHVFRYDMSPLFARLDDSSKPIPVLDEKTHRVRFIDAPRCYRVPLKMFLECGGVTWEDTATLVLHKRGLDRIEQDERPALDSDPALLDSGLEPG